jgi:hypothetical protein
MLLVDIIFVLIIHKSVIAPLYEIKIDFFKISKTAHYIKIVKINTRKARDVFVGFELPTAVTADGTIFYTASHTQDITFLLLFYFILFSM